MSKSRSSLVVVSAITAITCALAGFYFGGQVKIARNDEDDFYGFRVSEVVPNILRARTLAHQQEEQEEEENKTRPWSFRYFNNHHI